jgi:hypothetical protein
MNPFYRKSIDKIRLDFLLNIQYSLTMKTKNTIKRVTEKTITLNRTVKLMMDTVYTKGRVVYRERFTGERVRRGWPIRKEGFIVVFGHGIDDVIPMDALTLEETTYTEVVKVTKKNVKRNVLTPATFGW